MLEPVQDPAAAPLASVSLTVSPAVLHEGQPVTATATIGMTKGASKAGKVTFQASRDGGVTWANYASVVTKRDTVKVTGRWTATAGALSASLRAVFNPDYAGVATVTSSPRDVDVQRKESRVLGYPGTWDADYQGDGDKLPATVQIAQGYKDKVDGNKKGLIGFNVPEGEWSGWTITKVEVYLRFGKWYGGGQGTARIGSHTYTAAPSSDPVIKAGRTNVANWKQGVGKWVNITGWGKPLATRGLLGITLGPGRDNSIVYAGWANKVDAGDKPQLRVTGYRWS